MAQLLNEDDITKTFGSTIDRLAGELVLIADGRDNMDPALVADVCQFAAEMLVELCAGLIRADIANANATARAIVTAAFNVALERYQQANVDFAMTMLRMTRTE